MKLRKLLLGSVLAMSFAAQPAVADTLRYDGAMFSPYDGSFNIQDTSSSISWTGVAAGAFKMTDTSGPTLPANSSFMAWCIDITHAIASSTNYTLQSGNSFDSSAPYIDTDLERLASYVFDSFSTTLTNVQSAAFQLAAWEIVNESAGHGFYDAALGDFKVTSGDLVARNLANTWLGVVNGGTYAIDRQLGVWKQNAVPSNTQNLATFTAVPIPEPETYALLLAGLGLLSLMSRRRRNTAAV